jgi:hypothetical protein
MVCFHPVPVKHQNATAISSLISPSVSLQNTTPADEPAGAFAVRPQQSVIQSQLLANRRAARSIASFTAY